MSVSKGKQTTRTPSQERSIRTREAILQASMRLFSEKGFHQTNTKQIAAAAGVSTGSFYAYFADKREVFIEALKRYNQHFMDTFHASLEEVDLQNSGVRPGIAHVVDSLIRSHEVYTEFHNELEVMYQSDLEIKQLMDEQYEIGRRLTLEYLNLTRDQLRVTDIEAASFIVFETLDRLVDTIVFSALPVSPERIKAETIDMIAAYLLGVKE
ncbi:TetR/AcrR family transcriptional regulator [Paenibacillus thiaminolyticus]|uniref:TetR/AcrR family transcriptional regulator n=1 Tax=Paenibacillus thiaminolyticus TaxID=49283 RepID=UPI002542C19B|nr:TetR/AcrR family transcriptional regulator [Paenibacillus thiaminolyticus]WII36280.1 TetR/AcrR family transcriptional regulator [Paenibacillus thiaminolyticus]